MTNQAAQDPELHFDTKVVRSTLAALVSGIPLLIHQGGTYSGKTFGIMLGLYLYLKETSESLIVSVVSCTVPHLKRGALRDFETISTLISGLVYSNKSDHTFRVGNSIIEFFSADDNGKVRGGKRDILFLNEGNLIPHERYRQLALRTKRTAIVDFNPVAQFWIHEEYLGRPGTVFKRTTYRDNPATPAKIIRELEILKETDPDFYRIYGLGYTGAIKGLVFPRTRTAQKFPDKPDRFGYGLDFGYSQDVTALVQLGTSRGELFGRELLYEVGLDNFELRDRLKELQISRKATIWADAADPKSIAELRKFGYNVRAAKKGPDSVKFGIGLLKRYPINLTFDSSNWRKEAINYKWAEDKDGNALNTPVDLYNHCWDAARYWAIESLPDIKPRGAKYARNELSNQPPGSGRS
jgi:phage terminase large subunit